MEQKKESVLDKIFIVHKLELGLILGITLSLLVVIVLIFALTYFNRNININVPGVTSQSLIFDTTLGTYGVTDMFAVDTGGATADELNPCPPGSTLAGDNLNSGNFGADNIYLCQDKGNSTTGITNYILISGQSPDITCPDGYIRNELNLNSGVYWTSTFIYLCRQYGPPPFLQDINVSIYTDVNTQNACAADQYFNFGNINANTGSGSFVNICGRRPYLVPQPSNPSNS